MVAEGRTLPPFPSSLSGLGIGVGKGWEVVLEYGIGGGRGVPKRHTLGTKHQNHNICLNGRGLETSLTNRGQGFGGKIPLCFLCKKITTSMGVLYISYSVMDEQRHK